MNEFIDIYDNKANKTGIVKEKRYGLEENEYCLGAHAWIFNSEHKFLIQKRAANKRVMPNMWAPSGGSVRSGEDSIDTLIRELKEELGIDVDKSNIKLIMKHGGPDEWRCWVDVFAVEYDIALEKIVFNKNEVADVKWVSVEEINDMITKGEFVAFKIVRDTLYKIINNW